MGRSSLSILLAILVAFQSCLAGLAVCSGGGSCHAEAAESSCASGHVGCESERRPVPSIFVDADEPHPCECFDVEIDAGDAITGTRSELITPDPSPLMALWTAREHRFLIAQPDERRLPRARGDTPRHQQMAVLRATRLLL